MSVLKKIFFVSLLILVMSGLFWGIYNLSFKAPTEVAKPEPIATPTPEPPKKVAKITALTDEAVFSPAISSSDSSIKYYSQKTGQAYEIDFDGMSKKVISKKELVGLSEVLWSPDATKVITRFSRPDGTNDFFLYDYAQEKDVPLKKNLDEVAWQESGNKIFYKYFDPATKKRTLNIANPDGSEWKNLADLTYRNVAIAQIPKTSMVSFWNKPDAFLATDFESMPIIGGEKKKLFSDKFGADYLWDNSGNLVLASNTTEKAGSKMQLGIMNYNGGEYKNLDFPTFASKCAWSKDSAFLFCALPGGIPDSAILPNEYNENKFFTTDSFWKINVKTGEKSRLVEISEIGQRLDSQKPFLSSDESYLFFTNKIDGKLYRINL